MKMPKAKLSISHFLLGMIVTILLTGATTIADPTRPPASLIPAGKAAGASGSQQLLATFISPTRSFALISGQTLHVGDTIDTYTVINIKHDTVELKSSQNETLVLNLLPTVKQTSTTLKGR